MHRIRLVAWYEFWVTVRRPGYLVITFGMPLFALAVAAVSMVAGVTAARNAIPPKLGPIGLVDESGLFTLLEYSDTRSSTEIAAIPRIPDGLPDWKLLDELRAASGKPNPLQFRPYDSEAAAERALHGGEVEQFLYVPADYLETGRMEYRTQRQGSVFARDGAPVGLRAWVLENLLAGRLDPKLMARVKRPWTSLAVEILEPDGSFAPEQETRKLRRLAVPYLFLILLLMAIFGTSGYLLQGVAEEKENRVLEVLLCSVSPDQLLVGKLLGLGAAGLLQLLIWCMIAVLPTATAFSWLQIRPDTILVCFLYFISGYALFGGLMLGFGSLGSNYRESAQLAVVWSMIAIIPMFFIPIIVDSPNCAIARVLSYFPLTTPITMMMRYASGQVPWWDIGLSFVVLGLGIWVALKGSAKLFRVGLLLYGKKPTVPEIWKWLWA